MRFAKRPGSVLLLLVYKVRLAYGLYMRTARSSNWEPRQAAATLAARRSDQRLGASCALRLCSRVYAFFIIIRRQEGYVYNSLPRRLLVCITTIMFLRQKIFREKTEQTYRSNKKKSQIKMTFYTTFAINIVVWMFWIYFEIIFDRQKSNGKGC